MSDHRKSVVVSFEAEKAKRYLENAFSGFLLDPADSDFQRGYLSALLALYRDCLGEGVGDARLAILRNQVSS